MKKAITGTFLIGMTSRFAYALAMLKQLFSRGRGRGAHLLQIVNAVEQRRLMRQD